MSEATTLEAPITEEQQTPPAEEQLQAPPPEATDTPATETPTDQAPAEFRAEDQPEFKELFGDAPATPTKPEAELPGQSLDDTYFNLINQHATEYASLMQTFDRDEVQPFLREAWGLNPGEAQALYEKLRPTVTKLYQLNEGANQRAIDMLVEGLLSPEELTEYRKRDYFARDKDGRILPMSSRANQLKAVLALRDRNWQGKVESGELVAKAQHEAKLKDAFTKGGIARERWLHENGRLLGTTSGADVRGEAPSSQSEDAKLLDPNTPIDEINRILARRNGGQ